MKSKLLNKICNLAMKVLFESIVIMVLVVYFLRYLSDYDVTPDVAFLLGWTAAIFLPIIFKLFYFLLRIMINEWNKI